MNVTIEPRPDRSAGPHKPNLKLTVSFPNHVPVIFVPGPFRSIWARTRSSVLSSQRARGPEDIGALEEPLSDRRRDLSARISSSSSSTSSALRELADEFLAGIVAEVELLVLDLRDVSERDADLVPQRPLREVLGFSQFPEPFAESHVPPRNMLAWTILCIYDK